MDVFNDCMTGYWTANMATFSRGHLRYCSQSHTQNTKMNTCKTVNRTPLAQKTVHNKSLHCTFLSNRLLICLKMYKRLKNPQKRVYSQRDLTASYML